MAPLLQATCRDISSAGFASSGSGDTVRRLLQLRPMLGAGPREQRLVAHHIQRGAGHRLGHVRQALVRAPALALRGELPGMAGRADGVSGAARLHRRHRPAHVADVGRAHHRRRPSHPAARSASQSGASALHRQSDAAERRLDVLVGQRRLDLGGERAVRVVERRRAEALEIVVHRALQRRVAEQVGHRAEHLDFHPRFRHQRRTLGDLPHALDQPRQFGPIARGTRQRTFARACTTLGAIPPASSSA